MFKKVSLLILLTVFLASCSNATEETKENGENVVVETTVEETNTEAVLDPEAEKIMEEYMEEVSKEMSEAMMGSGMAPQEVMPMAGMKTYSMERVASYNTPEKCRTIINGSVYDITSFASEHEGGAEAIAKLCGVDGTEIFLKQHGNNEEQMKKLETLYKGELEK